MSVHDLTYNQLCMDILNNGSQRGDRTGTGTISLFGPQVKYDLREGFPLLTTKKVNFFSVMHELMWFLRGDTNLKTLKAPQLWAPWADENGDLGPVYGKQWVAWEKFHMEPTRTDIREGVSQISGIAYRPYKVNQIADLIERIKRNPNDRRLVVSAWNVGELDQMALPPCHVMFQCYVDGFFLDLKLYQRSADTAIGVPYNVASYALLQHLIARECGLQPRFFIHTFGDAHVYLNHVDKLTEQIVKQHFRAPSLHIANVNMWDLARHDDPRLIYVNDYEHGPFVKYEVAV